MSPETNPRRPHDNEGLIQMSEQSYAPVRIFISGACAGLAEARDSLASHKDIELVGTASEPSKAGPKLASTGAQVILHALQRPDHVPADEIAKIREHTAAPIILLVTRSTASLLDEAVEHGLNDVLLLPQLTDNLVFTVKKAHSLGTVSPGGQGGGRRMADASRMITLFSPKGGTGKTTLAANMGATFAKRLKKRTLLIDLDLQFGDVAIVLGTDPKTTILDLVMSHGELDADKVSGFVTHHESGLHVLPAPLRPEDAELITEDRLASMLTAAKQAYDIVLVDTPPNFNSSVLTALDRTDDLLVIASLDIPALKSVKVGLQTLEMLHYPLDRCHVLLNRSDSKVGLKKDEVEKVLAKPIRFGVPSNRLVPTAVNRGVPVVMSDPKCDVTRALKEICIALTPEGIAATEKVRERQAKISKKDRKRLEKQAEEQLRVEASSEGPGAVDGELGLDLDIELGENAA
jgi:pilus assembly protein CpaE